MTKNSSKSERKETKMLVEDYLRRWIPKYQEALWAFNRKRFSEGSDDFINPAATNANESQLDRAFWYAIAALTLSFMAFIYFLFVFIDGTMQGAFKQDSAKIALFLGAITLIGLIFGAIIERIHTKNQQEQLQEIAAFSIDALFEPGEPSVHQQRTLYEMVDKKIMELESSRRFLTQATFSLASALLVGCILSTALQEKTGLTQTDLFTFVLFCTIYVIALPIVAGSIWTIYQRARGCNLDMLKRFRACLGYEVLSEKENNPTTKAKQIGNTILLYVKFPYCNQ